MSMVICGGRMCAFGGNWKVVGEWNRFEEV